MSIACISCKSRNTSTKGAIFICHDCGGKYELGVEKIECLKKIERLEKRKNLNALERARLNSEKRDIQLSFFASYGIQPSIRLPIDKTISKIECIDGTLGLKLYDMVPAEKEHMHMEKINYGHFRNLFDAFSQNKLPFAHGYIVSSFFSETTAYSIYEIVSYAGVKEIFPTETGLQFITGGKKLFILVEHDTYEKKFIDPVSRAQGESIPKRFNELDVIIAKNQTKIYIAKEPDETYGSFTVLKPQGQNFAVVFYQLPDVYESITAFFLNSLNRQRRVPQADAKKAAQQISNILKNHMGFKGEFE